MIKEDIMSVHVRAYCRPLYDDETGIKVRCIEGKYHFVSSCLYCRPLYDDEIRIKVRCDRRRHHLSVSFFLVCCRPLHDNETGIKVRCDKGRHHLLVPVPVFCLLMMTNETFLWVF